MVSVRSNLFGRKRRKEAGKTMRIESVLTNAESDCQSERFHLPLSLFWHTFTLHMAIWLCLVLRRRVLVRFTDLQFRSLFISNEILRADTLKSGCKAVK